MRKDRLLFALLITLASGLGCGAEGDPQPGTARSAVVGNPQVSTAAVDFILFSTPIGESAGSTLPRGCGATLVAPNLVLTAKHCVSKYPLGESLCDATGEPGLGSAGGYTTGTLPPSDVVFYTGVSGRLRADQSAPPDAVAVKYFDDGATTLCSHDLAYVLLDRPVTNVPVAKLRLGRRPEPGDAVGIAGWGYTDYRARVTNRLQRDDLVVRRVGPPVVPQNPTGSLGPRTFETGPAGCSGDSGSPGFDPSNGSVFGVIARAGPLDNSHPVSPCLADTVVDQFMVVADFAPLLREAFTAAGAEPWLEDRASAGFVPFGESCSADLECAGGYCAGATDSTRGTCNAHCDAAVTCPSGTTCSATGACEANDALSTATDAGIGAGMSSADGGGCSMSPRRSSWSAIGLIALSASLAFRSRTRRPRLLQELS